MFNWIKNLFEDRIFGAERNPRWVLLSRRYREDFPNCEVCGKKAKETHHIIPVHIDKSKELVWDNLLAVCRECHFSFCHFFSWKSFNKDIEEDIERINNRP